MKKPKKLSPRITMILPEKLRGIIKELAQKDNRSSSSFVYNIVKNRVQELLPQTCLVEAGEDGCYHGMEEDHHGFNLCPELICKNCGGDNTNSDKPIVASDEFDITLDEFGYCDDCGDTTCPECGKESAVDEKNDSLLICETPDCKFFNKPRERGEKYI